MKTATFYVPLTADAATGTLTTMGWVAELVRTELGLAGSSIMVALVLVMILVMLGQRCA